MSKIDLQNTETLKSVSKEIIENSLSFIQVVSQFTTYDPSLIPSDIYPILETYHSLFLALMQVSNSEDEEKNRLEDELYELQQSNITLQVQLNELKDSIKKPVQSRSDYSDKAALNDALAKIKQLEVRLREKDAQSRVANLKTRESQREEIRNEIIHCDLKSWNRACCKIQSVWKGYKQRKRYYELIKDYISRTRKQARSHTTDEVVMRIVSSAISSRNLTLEQCFRAADSDSDGTVSTEEFSHFLISLKLNLTQAQITRLMLILDEDCSGRIDSREFYDALSAYQVAKEKHRQGNRTFQQEVLIKFCSVMCHRGIEPEEIFNLCDTDNSGYISSKELEKFLKGLSAGFQQKEIHALMSLLDADNSGEINREEFLLQMGKGIQAHKIDSVIGYPISLGNKSSSSPISASKNNAWMTEDTPQANFAQNISSAPKNDDIKRIVQKMESRGMSLAEAFDTLEPDSKGKLTITSLTRSINKWFPHLNRDEVLKIITSIDIDRNSQIDYKELQDFLLNYSNHSKLTLKQILNQIAEKIDKTNLDTEEYFRRQGVSGTLDLSSFINTLGKWFNLTDEQSAMVFNSLDLDRRGAVQVGYLCDVINSYRKNPSKKAAPAKMTQLADTYTKSVENAPAELVTLLASHNLEPMNVFRFADKRQLGVIQVSDFQNALRRLIPNISEDLLNRLLEVFPSSTIRKADIDAIFTPVPQVQLGELDQNGLTLEQVFWIRRLITSLEEHAVDPRALFDLADLNRDELASMAEMRGAIRRSFSSAEMGQIEIGYIVKSIDTKRGASISKKELLDLIDKAKRSSHPPEALDKLAKEKGVKISSSTGVSNTVPTEKADPKPKSNIISPAKTQTTQPVDFKVETKARPLPISAVVPSNRLKQSIQTLSSQTGSMATVQYFGQMSIFPTSLLSQSRFMGLFPKTSLSEMDMKEIFRALDIHNKGSIYGYILFTVLDSYKNTLQYLPAPHNSNTEAFTKFILQESILKIDKNELIHKCIHNDLRNPIEDWKRALEFLNVLPQNVQLISATFPNPAFYYQLAAVIQSYALNLLLDPEEIMHCAFSQLPQKQNALDLFATYSLQPSDILEKAEFLEHLSSILNLKPLEATELYRAVYGPRESARPLYSFMTYFDMILSTYEGSEILYPIPSLPMNYNPTTNPLTKSFFNKLATAFVQPLFRYGLSLNTSYSLEELADILLKNFSIKVSDSVTFLNLSKMNKMSGIRVYHLVTVLDSYRNTPISLIYFPTEAFQSIAKSVPRNMCGATWLRENKGCELGRVMTKSEFVRNCPNMDRVDMDSLFMFIDVNDRGSIYAHQLATVIDIALNLKSTLANFPLVQNPKAPKEVKIIIKENAKNLDNYRSSAYEYYTSKGFDLEQRLDYETFKARFVEELTSIEVQRFYQCIELNGLGYIRFYHYVSAIESYCKSPPPAVKTARLPTWGEQLPTVALSLPENVATIQVFSPMKVEEVIDDIRFLSIASKYFKIDSEAAQRLFSVLDDGRKGKVFGFQLFTMVDVYRSCVEEGRIAYNLPQLPFNMNQEKDPVIGNLIKAVAYNLDTTGSGTCDYFWKLDIELDSRVNNPTFNSILRDLEPAQATAIFKSLDFQKSGNIIFYHFLSVLESYRAKFIPNKPRPEKPISSTTEEAKKPEVKTSWIDKAQPYISTSPTGPLSPILTPLQDALTKLGKYFQGENEKGRGLSSREIFGIFDSNKDGKITNEEFMRTLDRLPLDLTEQQKNLLKREADINNDGNIDYQEFIHFVTDFVSNQPKPKTNTSVDVAGLVSYKRRPVSQIKAMDRSMNEFKEGSLEHAIYKLKLYIKSNADSFTSMELTFQRLDEDGSGSLNELEFQLALDRLKLGLTKKQKEDLMNISDKNSDGEISYLEFIDFIYDYDFSQVILPEPEESLIRTHTDSFNTDVLRSAISSKLDISTGNQSNSVKEVKNYIIDPANDYFNQYNSSCTTILNSEFAALKRCIELLKSSTKFRDPEFGPEQPSNGAFCLYWNGKPPNTNYPPAKELSWMSPSEFTESAVFFDDNISSNDVIQGSLGDCWFIGALSVLATRDDLVRGSIAHLTKTEEITPETALGISKGVYPPIFHCFAKKGLYVLRFFKNCAWRWVIIDDRVPVYAGDGIETSYVFGHCKNNNEIWVALVEKAYAKLHGCYEALNGGMIDDGLVDLTGLVAEKIKLKGKNGFLGESPDQEKIKADQLWEKMKQFRSDGTLMGCSVDSVNVESEVIIDGEHTGILAGHAYSILDILYIPNPRAYNTKKRHRLIRLRNPWGQREWQGKWSDRSDELRSNLDLVQAEVAKLGDDENWNPEDSNDGTFMMCFRDWRSIYDNLYSCVDFAEAWSGVRFEGEWTRLNSGGVPTTPNKEHALRWSKNPQYVIEAKSGFEMFISLQQEDGRCVKGMNFPYEGVVKTACFSIMRLDGKENRVSFFDSNKIIALSTLKLHREISKRIELSPGKYAIVPSTMNPGDTNKFWLSIYYSCDKKYIKIYNADTPSEEGGIIQEEEEVTPDSITPDILKELRSLLKFLQSI
jgi:Ca2+-binding EF-hand superfamily protein